MTHLIRIDTAARRAWQGDRYLPLGQREYALLALLVRQHGTVSFDVISRRVYEQPLDDRARRVVQQLAASVRLKLGDRYPHRYIVSVRGVGFFVPRDLVAAPERRIEIEGTQYDVLHWHRQADHGGTAVWTLYARPSQVAAR
ncbi:winged helix-turn-helix domain-containing protein [Nonomuraea bangladeshensis]|uniref:Winged helix-turn-helix domain-containing protein n=1 Tax=Nonomuraea bangladeshensis TaxID=404385 RepID=A0ABV3H4F8_9ACTN